VKIMSQNSRLRTAGALALALALALAPRPAAAQCDCSTIPILGEALNYPAMSLFKDINISGSV
jgi:hypothetical protein